MMTNPSPVTALGGRLSTIALACVLGFFVAPIDAQAQDLDPAEEMATTDDEDMAAEEGEKPWGITMTLRSMVGQGTFASPSNDTEWADEVGDGSGAWNRWNLVYSLSPSYELGDFSFAVTFSWVQWLTEAGGIRTTAGAGGANQAREFRFQDISADIGWRSFTSERFGVTLTPALSFRFPGDAISRNSTFRTEAGGSLSLSRTFLDDLNLVAGLSASRWFHEFTSPVVDIDTIGIDNALYRPGEAEDIAPGRFAISGYNIQYRVSPTLSASLTLPASFSASIGYGLHNYWTYKVDNADDELSPEHARDGRGFSQVAATAVGLQYGVNDWVSTSLSFNTIQPPKTSDNKSFRFPFWNFASPAANYSSVSLSIEGSY